VEDVRAQAKLAQRYNEALGALKTGNLSAAKYLLAEVIGQQPDYKEAPRYLLLATTGLDVANFLQSEAVAKWDKVAIALYAGIAVALFLALVLIIYSLIRSL
jgi:hypothetical protein